MGSNQEFSCTSTAVILKGDLHNGTETGIIRFNSVHNSGVDHCTIQGTNTAVPAALDSNQWNSQVWVVGRGGTPSHDISISYNDIRYSWSNGAVRIDGTEGTPNVPSYNIAAHNNTYENNGYYGLTTISATYVTVSNETMVDSSCGAEPNSSTTDTNAHNIYNNISVTYVHGNCAGSQSGNCNSGVMLTGGQDYGNFSTDIVENSTLSGIGAHLDTGLGSGGIAPAQYLNNKCINGANGC